MIQDLIRKVKRRETPLADLAYRAAKRLRAFELPAPRLVWLPVWYLHHGLRNGFRWLTRIFYYQPMFRARCERVGRNLRVDLGAPYVYGDIHIRIGDDCTMNAISSFVATSVGKDAVLEIGDKTYMGHRVSISVGSRVSIGSHVLIADNVFIADNPGHPLDAAKRRVQGVEPEQIRPVTIGDDVWIGHSSKIMPGVTIGECSVVAAGSIVTKDVPAYTLVAGAPARPVRSLRPEPAAAAVAAPAQAPAKAATAVAVV
jgi:acetyltransferase-like isoleucine patch superfamily enzyme